MLLCDGCNAGWHMGCLPGKKLKVVPKGNWFCPSCAAKTAKIDWRAALTVGYSVRAQDVTGQWLEGKVIEVEGGRALVHFLGWNSKYDEWYAKKSPKMEPLANAPKNSECLRYQTQLPAAYATCLW
jgi:hypothetical protein